VNVGIYAPNWIGDAVLSLPFLNLCRRTFPEARITIVAKAWVAAVFEHHPSVDSIIIFDGAQLKGLLPTIRSGRSLKAAGFDRFYLLSDSLRSAFLAWLARSRERIGFSRMDPASRGQFRSPFLTRPVPPPRADMHRAHRYLLLMGNSTAAAAQTASPGITLTEEEHAWAAGRMARLQLTEPVAVLPSSVAESRRVPLAKWVAFLAPYLDARHEILFIGSQRDQPVSEALVQKLNRPVKGRAFDRPAMATVCGQTTLRQAMALITRCQGALATDSGLGHIAANLGVKTVSIFGAGDPAITRPLGPRAGVVSKPVHCSPCLKNVCRNHDEPLLCLNATPDHAVWEAYHAL